MAARELRPADCVRWAAFGPQLAFGSLQFPASNGNGQSGSQTCQTWRKTGPFRRPSRVSSGPQRVSLLRRQSSGRWTGEEGGPFAWPSAPAGHSRVALQRPRCANSNRLQLGQSPNAKLATCQVWPQASLVQFWQLQQFGRLEQLSLEFSTARLAWTSIVDKLAAWTNWSSSGAHLGAQICLLANQQAPHRHSSARGSAQLALVAASCRAVDGRAQVHLGAHLRAFASAGFALYLHVNAGKSRPEVGCTFLFARLFCTWPNNTAHCRRPNLSSGAAADEQQLPQSKYTSKRTGLVPERRGALMHSSPVVKVSRQSGRQLPGACQLTASRPSRTTSPPATAESLARELDWHFRTRGMRKCQSGLLLE